MGYSFVLIDHTTSATPSAIAPGPFLSSLGLALLEFCVTFDSSRGFLTSDFVRVASSPTDRQPSEIAVNFRDTIPEAPGALAYHQVTNGVPDIEIGCDLFSSLSSGSESLSVGVSHEVGETKRDAGANGWKTRLDGATADAEEACDFVESTFWQSSTGVALSNFVLESFFIPGAPGPWDHLGVMTSQQDVSHGYGIVATVSGDTQIGGEKMAERRTEQKIHTVVGYDMPENVRKRKAHPYSRLSRRGAKLAGTP